MIAYFVCALTVQDVLIVQRCGTLASMIEGGFNSAYVFVAVVSKARLMLALKPRGQTLHSGRNAPACGLPGP
jgi:hypothetical protein